MRTATAASARRVATRWLGVQAALVLIAFSACTHAEVDPKLVGTWQLQGAAQPVFWTIRADGTYEISGPGAGTGHSGSFAAGNGKWTLQSATWGQDGGNYQLPGADTFIGVGRLGPGTWKRTTKVVGPKTVLGNVPLRLQSDANGIVPKDIPELLFAATRRAQSWREDAIAVSLDYEDVNAPNMKGPQIQVSFYSPASHSGMRMTVGAETVSTFEFQQKVDWGRTALPIVFVDLPAAARHARENGMRGGLRRARLAIHHPPGAPQAVLAWTLTPSSSGEGRAIDATTGEIINYDLTGYIAAYNAQWEKAARGLRALWRHSRPASSEVSYDAMPDSTPGSSGVVTDDSAARAEQERIAAEARAYWGGSAEDYNRIKNGECSWSDSQNYGC